ncbi:MAG: DUF4197 domain-containing protein [Saprospiraceae bacterium]|nr:DUF4197 domain-containing protein [Saprospiraceae bacterium]
MQKWNLFLATLAMIISTSCSSQTLGGLLNKANQVLNGELSEEEIGKGLKEALNKGVNESVDFLAKENGYYETIYKILLPEEAEVVVSKLRMVPGFSNVEANLIEKINRAAEGAARKAGPIFLDAIKQMSFNDVTNILMGEDDAATRYLESTTYEALYNEFQPVIIASLDEVNARSYWKEAVTTYNKIPFTKDVNPELDDHVATKALVGLFSLVEKKEAEIRDNPAARTTDLLRKVFAQQDN